MLSAIVAIGQNAEIGKNNKLPWSIKEDLKYFKKITTNKTIIMGRATFESLPYILPNRKHMVLTKNQNFFVNDSRVCVVHDIHCIKELAQKENEEAFVIGGGQIYTALLQYCSKLYITRIHKSFSADTYFSNIDLSRFFLCSSQKNYSNEEQAFFSFEIWQISAQPR